MSLEDYRYDIEMCLRCSSCKWIDPMWSKSKRFNKICPINSHFHYDAYSSQGIMDIALAILDGEMPYTETLADIVYHCTLCGACDVMCKRTLETERLLVIEEVRKELANSQLMPQKPVARIQGAVSQKHNAYGAPHDKRFAWLDNDRRSQLNGSADVIYFVGCTSAYRHPEIAQATVDLLSAAGIKYTVMDAAEWCCGNPLLRLGLQDDARQVMTHNLEAVRTLGAKTVITSCAECYHMWKVDYPRQHDRKSLDYNVLHVTELLADQLKQGTFKFTNSVEMRVTYHDSCRLARLSEPHEPWAGKRVEYGRTIPPKIIRQGTNGVYFPPRKVLEAIPGLEFVEMERVRENAFCCGAGGGVKQVHNDFAMLTGAERLTEATAAGVQALVSACPFCKWNFKDVALKDKMQLEVLDIVELAARAI